MFRGEDESLSITLTDSANALQDIDAMSDLVVVLYSARLKKVLASYRKVATAGYTTLLRVSATEYTAIVPYTITDDFPLADLMMEAEVIISDARFPDGKKRTKGKGIVTEVLDSVIDG